MNILRYKGFWGCDSVCGLEIKELGDGKVAVILTELEDNSGTSVTNFYEYLATEVYWKYLAPRPVESIIWIEHYPENPRIEREAVWDRVFLRWDGRRFSNPQWRPLDRETKGQLGLIH